MDWPAKRPSELDASEKRSVGKGVFKKCDKCGVTATAEFFAATFEVCTDCGHHHRLAHARWRALLLDEETLLEEWDATLSSVDPLEFTDGKPYTERIASATKS